MPKRKRILVELLLIIVTAIAYFYIKTHDAQVAGISYYSTALLLCMEVAIGIALIIVVASILEAYGKLSGNEKDMHETTRMFRLIAYPILLLIILHTLDISITSLLIGAGFLGIVIGLAAQTTLGNVFSSLSIMYSRPFVRGEKITVVPTSYSVISPTYPHDAMMNEITGTVKHIGLVYTKILRDDTSMVYMPNTALNSGLIINHSRVSERQIRVRLEVPRTIDNVAFKERLTAKLTKDTTDYLQLRDFSITLSLISEDHTYGVSITARVKILDYDRLSQWITENAIATLAELEKKGSKKK